MSIHCPYCQHTVKVKGVKAGRFTPKCPQCKKAFVLMVVEKEGKLRCGVKALAEKSKAPDPTPEAEPDIPQDPAMEKTEADAEMLATGAWDADESDVHDETVAGNVHQDAEFAVDEAVEEETFSDSEPDTEPTEIVLGNFEVKKKLGKGGMGTVYLARQISLDRAVALKVMNKKWAKDPTFLARFIREAYAAAQLVHHNIVQIYDIGEDRGIHYFSMELVKGKTLNDLLKKNIRLDVEEATSYILQAARGLHFAHQQGMIHRDIKPDNLMINDQGVVKVADLGLVKTPGVDDLDGGPRRPPSEEALVRPTSLSDVSNVTQVGLAVGTPAYMAPEQWKSAADVEASADIYSLGCTWYALLTGKPPFKGKTALEMMTMHVSEPPVPPNEIVNRIPEEVSKVLMRMIAKKPEDRQTSMGEVITDLEGLLGLSQAGPFTASEEQAETLEKSVKQFNEVPAARLRSKVVPGFFAACGLITVLSCFFSLRLAGGIIGLALLTAVFTFLVQGLTQKTYLYIKTREFVLGSRWTDWASWSIGLLLALAILYVTGLLKFWLAFCVLAAALAGGYYTLVLKPLEHQRRESLDHAKKLLKQIRLRGIPEEGAQQFVCKYGGDHWEEFFEDLFGYERMRYARNHWAPIGGEKRKNFATWRDPIVRWIDAQQEARRKAIQREHLQRIEQESLEAQGIDKVKAKEQAENAADAMVEIAAGIKSQQSESSLNETTAHEGIAANAQLLMKAADQPQQLPTHLKRSAEGRGATAIVNLVIGGKSRFLAGAVLIVFFALWVQHNHLVASGDLNWDAFKLLVERSEPLGFLPGVIGDIFSGFNVGVAGLLLIISAFTRNPKMLVFLLLGAVVALLGHQVGVPSIGGFEAQYVSLLAGLALAEFGVVFTRMTTEKE